MQTIEAAGGKATAYKVDAMDTAAVRAFAEAASGRAGKKIDVLANVVGGLVARKKMDEMDDAFWDYVLALNVKSIFAMTQAALPLMNDGGRDCECVVAGGTRWRRAGRHRVRREQRRADEHDARAGEGAWDRGGFA